MDRTTITANLKPLERRGLLTVRRDSKDARIKFVALTAAGRTLLAECMSHWQAANASARAILDKRHLQSFYSDLDHIAVSSS
jgi:DNA-binding MarR family transcriptional regulator